MDGCRHAGFHQCSHPCANRHFAAAAVSIHTAAHSSSPSRQREQTWRGDYARFRHVDRDIPKDRRWDMIQLFHSYREAGWFADLQQRIKELESWSADFQLPSAVWLAGLPPSSGPSTSRARRRLPSGFWEASPCCCKSKSRRNIEQFQHHLHGQNYDVTVPTCTSCCLASSTMRFR